MDTEKTEHAHFPPPHTHPSPHTLSHTPSLTLTPIPSGAQRMAPTDGGGGGLSLPPCKGIIKTMSSHGNDYMMRWA